MEKVGKSPFPNKEPVRNRGRRGRHGVVMDHRETGWSRCRAAGAIYAKKTSLISGTIFVVSSPPCSGASFSSASDH